MALIARVACRLGISLLLTLCCAGSGFAQKRFALVIGNYNYAPSVGPLKTPQKDQELIAKALTDIKFMVVSKENATRADIGYEVDVLGDKLEAAGDGAIGFLYYSGHGAARAKVNYLIPVDVKEPQDQKFWYDTVPIDEIIKALTDKAPKASIFIVFDACRNELHLPTKSLGAKGFEGDSIRQTDGVVIAFSTGPNTTAPDIGETGGAYARSLAVELVKPGQNHVELFQHVKEYVADHSTVGQRPWIEDGLPHGLFLSAGSGVPASNPGPSPAPTPTAGPSEAERAWGLAKDTTSEAVVEDFIRRFGDTFYATLARQKLEQLKAKSQVAVATPAATPAVASPPDRLTSLGPKAVEPSPASHGEAAAPPFIRLSPDQERALKPSQHFKECSDCPEMVTTPPGTFLMGSPVGEPGREANEGPQQQIVFAQKFAVGLSTVSFDEWNACVAEGGCNAYRPGDYGWGRGKRPVINVSWDDAQAYVKWLSQKTGTPYRLLSEAEHEYATRGCTSPTCPSTPFWFGAQISPDRANYDWRYSYNGSAKKDPLRGTIASDASLPNPFGLLQVHGNVREWVEDCWNETLTGIPRDGSARISGDCTSHVLRNGSWKDEPKDLRSAKRSWELANERQAEIGFRVARRLQN